MAVLEELGIAVSVVMDGEAAQEYDDPEPVLEHGGQKIDPTVTAVCNKYIMAKDDTQYLVRLEVLPQHTWVALHKKNVLSFKIYIDGKYRDGSGLRNNDLLNGTSREDVESIKMHGSGGWSVRKLSFGTITTTDVADLQKIKADKERAADMGTIRVVVRRQRFRKMEPQRRRRDNDVDLTIAEQALKGKAVSHGTTLSRTEVGTRGRVMNNKNLDDYPIAIFNFKYRSKDALRQERIVPRTPSPTPAQIVAGLDQTELQRLAMERLVDLRVKREKDDQMGAVKDEPGTQSRPVKREFADAFDSSRDSSIVNPQPLRKMARLSNGRLQIDLTDD